MEETFRVLRLTLDTPVASQDELQRALEAVPGVGSVRLKPDTHEFVIENNGAKRAEVIRASTRAGFHIRNNVAVSG